MRRSRKLAAAALAGTLLATVLGAAGATAADTDTQLTLTSVAGAISITAPVTTTTGAVDLGSVATGAGTKAAPNSLGEVKVTDPTTGVLRIATVTAESGLADPTVAFCQDDADLANFQCDADAFRKILSTNVTYKAGTVTVAGDGSGTVANAGVLGAPVVTFTQVVPGSYTLTWNPTFDVTLLGTELAGTYQGKLVHSVTATP